MIKYKIFGMVFVKLNLSYALFLIFLRILIFENENETEMKMAGKRAIGLFWYDRRGSLFRTYCSVRLPWYSPISGYRNRDLRGPCGMKGT